MNWGPLGHVRVDPSSPQAMGTCDICGRIWNLVDLRWQFQWSGNQLINLRYLVCEKCYDNPQEQLRAITLPPDPVPVLNPRPEPVRIEAPSFASTLGGDNMATLAGQSVTSIEGIVPIGQTPPSFFAEPGND